MGLDVSGSPGWRRSCSPPSACHRASIIAKGYRRFAPPRPSRRPRPRSRAWAGGRRRGGRRGDADARRGSAGGKSASAGPRDGGGGARASTDRGERARARRHRGGAAGGEPAGADAAVTGRARPAGRRAPCHGGGRGRLERGRSRRVGGPRPKARRGGAARGGARARRGCRDGDKAAPVVLGDVDVRQLMRALMRRGRNDRADRGTRVKQKIGLTKVASAAIVRAIARRPRRIDAASSSAPPRRSRRSRPAPRAGPPARPPRRLGRSMARGERSRLGDARFAAGSHRARRARAAPASTRRRASRPRVVAILPAAVAGVRCAAGASPLASPVVCASRVPSRGTTTAFARSARPPIASSSSSSLTSPPRSHARSLARDPRGELDVVALGNMCVDILLPQGPIPPRRVGGVLPGRSRLPGRPDERVGDWGQLQLLVGRRAGLRCGAATSTTTRTAGSSSTRSRRRRTLPPHLCELVDAAVADREKGELNPR